MKNPYQVATFKYFHWFFSYEPETGEFKWKNCSAKSKRRPGDRAGYQQSSGYTILKVSGKIYKAHRVAWLMVYGVWPDMEVDHVDRNGHNNALRNLRLADASQNKFNKAVRSDAKLGVKGVHWSVKHKRYYARIMAYGERKFLGAFDNIEDAKKAYSEAAKQYHGEFHRA